MPTPWTTRIWREYRAGNLTRAARDVLLTLHTFRGTGGACWPSHATLADRAKCCTRTVLRALQAAQRLGLLDWVERRVRAGWRWLRSSNIYRFTTPMMPVIAAARPVSKAPALTDSMAAEVRVSKKEALDELRRAAARLPDLLAARRAAIEGRGLRQPHGAGGRC
jgi:helix-turn-helix protein